MVGEPGGNLMVAVEVGQRWNVGDAPCGLASGVVIDVRQLLSSPAVEPQRTRGPGKAALVEM